MPRSRIYQQREFRHPLDLGQGDLIDDPEDAVELEDARVSRYEGKKRSGNGCGSAPGQSSVIRPMRVRPDVTPRSTAARQRSIMRYSQTYTGILKFRSIAFAVNVGVPIPYIVRSYPDHVVTIPV
jgi:hypothetical protein